MRLLRAADRIATPWKNGGGVTTEIAAFPPGSTLENFGWRVSIAEVRSGGPFSVFPGIDRQLAVLAGRLRLEIAGRAPAEITAVSPPTAFAGDVATSGTPLDGPVLDLNVMTRRGRFAARMERHVIVRETKVAFDAVASIAVALASVRLGQFDLVNRDAVWYGGPAEVPVAPRSERGELITIEIVPA
jgi:uncharacterized protein